MLWIKRCLKLIRVICVSYANKHFSHSNLIIEATWAQVTDKRETRVEIIVIFSSAFYEVWANQVSLRYTVSEVCPDSPACLVTECFHMPQNSRTLSWQEGLQLNYILNVVLHTRNTIHIINFFIFLRLFNLLRKIEKLWMCYLKFWSLYS